MLNREKLAGGCEIRVQHNRRTVWAVGRILHFKLDGAQEEARGFKGLLSVVSTF
jgi:hypothetical protein